MRAITQCQCGHTEEWHSPVFGSCGFHCSCTEFTAANTQASLARRVLASLLGVRL